MTGRDDDDDHLAREFAITYDAAPRHLNDVAMTSPETKLLRGASGDSFSGKTKAGAIVLSMAQQDVM